MSDEFLDYVEDILDAMDMTTLILRLCGTSSSAMFQRSSRKFNRF